MLFDLRVLDAFGEEVGDESEGSWRLVEHDGEEDDDLERRMIRGGGGTQSQTVRRSVNDQTDRRR